MGDDPHRDRPGWRDLARERNAQLPGRQGHRQRPVHPLVPGSPVSVSGTARRVLVVGSANVDFTVAASRLPRVGETVSGGTLLVHYGGEGGNQGGAPPRAGAEGG